MECEGRPGSYSKLMPAINVLLSPHALMLFRVMLRSTIKTTGEEEERDKVEEKERGLSLVV